MVCMTDKTLGALRLFSLLIPINFLRNNKRDREAALIADTQKTGLKDFKSPCKQALFQPSGG